MKKLFLFLLLFPLLSVAQSTLSTKSKKAAGYYYQADNFWVRGQYNMALDLLEQAIDKDDKFFEAYFRLGVIEKARGKSEIAESHLKKTLSIKPDHAGANLELGELYIIRGEYEKSLNFLRAFLALNPKNAKRKAEANQLLESANYAIENIDKSTSIHPKPLPDNINQFVMQYFPVLTADQTHLIYTRRNGTTLNDEEDLVIALKDASGKWGNPESISENINTSNNEGTCTISADGRILIFTSCYGREGLGGCDLYLSRKSGEKWSIPVNLGPNVNSSAWDSQPSLSADGRTLYFISNRRNGIGGRDIWVSTMNESEEWNKAKNLGTTINTRNEEVSPFIHPNNCTLYYATNGRVGYGGFDIFYSEAQSGGWSTPINVGYPINTGEDQVSLFITADGKTGYYSHERLADEEKKGELYQFDLPEKMQQRNRAYFVKGKVFDKITQAPLKAKIELYNLALDQRISVVNSDSLSGDYLMVLPEGSDYALYVSKKGYLFKSLSFEFNSDSLTKPVFIDIPLSIIGEGNTTELNNIFFDFDKYDLKDQSKTELQKVISFLKSNPNIKIEIAGYTDNIGKAEYNLVLSSNRAKSVYDYLIKLGVPKNTLVFKGYGQNNPVATNENEAGRRKNRRIVFRVIK